MKRNLIRLALGLSLAMGSAHAVTTVQYASWDISDADKAVVEAFNKSHPDIQVKVNLVPWGVYWQKAATMTAGGATFDVMWMNLDNFPFYQAQGALAPLQVDAKTMAAMPKNLSAPFVVGGQVYGIPVGPQAVTVYINRALFKERGVPIPTKSWTWEQMRAAAKKLTFTNKEGKPVYGINGGGLRIDSEYGLSFYNGAGGTGIFKQVNGKWVAKLDPIFQKTSQDIVDLIYKDKVSSPVSGTKMPDYQLFLAGQLGIFIEGSWDTGTWAQNKNLDWAFAPFPKIGNNPVRPTVSAHAMVIPASSKNKDAAMKFLLWRTTSAEAQSILAKGGLLPTHANQFKAQYLQALPGRNAQTVFDQLDNSVIKFTEVRSVKALPEVLTVLGQNLELVYTKNDPQGPAMQKAEDAMNKLLQQDK